MRGRRVVAGQTRIAFMSNHLEDPDRDPQRNSMSPKRNPARPRSS